MQPRRRKLAPKPSSSVRCFFRLESSQEGSFPNGLRWVQVAYEGAWKGHAFGEFQFAVADLQTMVANFHRHPSYRSGAEQAPAQEVESGAYDVIAFDWRHASTGPAGKTPIEMQVAQAWACDLKVEVGADGRAELYALTRYLEPMGSFVRDGKVHWTSITADPHYVDPVSGEDRGWYVEAIAFTNDPFLQGMGVAADRSGAVEFWRGYDPYAPPMTASDVLEALRSLFEIPATSDFGAVMAELAKLRQWATSGGAPVGVDVPELVGCIRQCLNLPVLTPAADVFAATDSLLAALAEEEPPASARAEGLAAKRVSSSNPTKPSAKSSAVALGRNATAMHPALAKLLAKIAAAGFQLGRASTDEDAVEAIHELIAKHKASLEGGASATQGLQAVLAALGVEDVDGATKKIAEMFKSVDQLEKAMPELKALRETQEAAEDEAAEKDVGEAMKAHRMPDTARPALVAMRTGGHVREKGRTLSPEESRSFLAARKAAREKFAASYAVLPEAAGLLGAAYPNPAAGASGGSVEMRRTNPEGDTRIAETAGIGGQKIVDLTRLDGRNRFERALTYVEQHDPKAKQYSRPEKFSAARRLLQQPNVLTGD